jgi:hypothetical protein
VSVGRGGEEWAYSHAWGAGCLTQANRNQTHRNREHKTGMFLGPQGKPLPPPPGSPPEPIPGDYGSAVCNVRLAMKLLGDPTLLATSDHRKSFPMAMVQQLSDRYERIEGDTLPNELVLAACVSRRMRVTHAWRPGAGLAPTRRVLPHGRQFPSC